MDEDDDLVSCPVCSLFCPQSEIEGHVALHFADEPLAAAGPTQRQQQPQQQHEALHIDDDDDDDAVIDADEQKVYCSFGCGALLALHELDSHEEAHRLQELEQQQFELQQQDVDQEHQQLQMKYGFSDKRPGKCFCCGQEGHWSGECPSNPQRQRNRPQERLPVVPAQLDSMQQPDRHAQLHSVNIIPLLQACFEAQPKPHSIVFLSGAVGFHSGSGQADSGWGCGFRNIQMQISHQLMRGDQAVRQALFGGCGFVPDIVSLQAWLETAWAAGFDPGGAAMFGGSVQCSRKWVGTTEAAALLRYFGCRAQLVEFLGKAPPTAEDATGATIHSGFACDVCQQGPITGIRYKSYQTPNYHVCSSCRQSPAAQQHAPFRAFGRRARASAAAGASSCSRGNSRGALPAANGSGRGQPSILQYVDRGSSSSNHNNNQQQQQPQQFAGSSTGPRSSNQDSSRPAGAAAGSAASSSAATAAAAAAGGGAGAGSQQVDTDRHRRMAEWIWAYFSQGSAVPAQQQQQQQPPGWLSADHHPAAAAASGAAGQSAAASAAGISSGSNGMQKVQRRNPVIVTGKPPLYLQHEGHSRTVVGIERCLSPQAEARAGVAAAEYSLVILDPGMPAQELLSSLRSKQGWQRRVKRGLNSLARKPEYQVLYIAPGLVPDGPARDSLKAIAAEDRC